MFLKKNVYLSFRDRKSLNIRAFTELKNYIFCSNMNETQYSTRLKTGFSFPYLAVNKNNILFLNTSYQQ